MLHSPHAATGGAASWLLTGDPMGPNMLRASISRALLAAQAEEQNPGGTVPIHTPSLPLTSLATESHGHTNNFRGVGEHDSTTSGRKHTSPLSEPSSRLPHRLRPGSLPLTYHT